jgi:hypothetical protein
MPKSFFITRDISACLVVTSRDVLIEGRQIVLSKAGMLDEGYRAARLSFCGV